MATTTLTWGSKTHFDGSTAFVVDSGGDLNLPVQITTAGTTAVTTGINGLNRDGVWLILNTATTTVTSQLFNLPSPSPGCYLDVIIGTTSSQSTGSPQIYSGSASASFLNPLGSTATFFALATSSGIPAGIKILNLVGVSTAMWAVVGIQPTSGFYFSATSS